MSHPRHRGNRIDWIVTFVPMALVIALCVLFFMQPEASNVVLGRIRYFFGDTMGAYYLIIGLGIFAVSMYLAFSRYGRIVLGQPGERPKYSFFTWGSMMFTAGLAADLIFYSFSEWVMYASDPRLQELGDVYRWAGVYPLFHWSFIPWAFYLVLAVAFAFMLHVRKRGRQKYSEACRPLLGRYTDRWGGRLIDLLAVFALIAGTATTFSVATPLISSVALNVFGIHTDASIVTIVILVITCCIYTYALLHGIKGISVLARVCIYMFFALLVYVLVFGGNTKYIIETGLTSLGVMTQNFIELSTYTDPLRSSSFPQNWTIYYWAYWMVWCVAAPFFIGTISRGRTVKQTIIGGYVFGIGSTVISFIILGNYSMGLQQTASADFVGQYQATGDAYAMITDVIGTLPVPTLVLLLVMFTMIAFYCTSFDSIALTASKYSYRRLDSGEAPHRLIQLLWCVLLILLPISLVFAESSMHNLQTVSIVAAFPIGVVMILIVWSFFKDANSYLSTKQHGKEQPEQDTKRSA